MKADLGEAQTIEMQHFYEKMKTQINKICQSDPESDPLLKSEIVHSLLQIQKNKVRDKQTEPFSLQLKPHTKHFKQSLKDRSKNNINPLL